MYVMREEHDQRLTMLTNPILHSHERNEFIPDTEFFMSDELPGVSVKNFLQAMSDAAWEIGIRPKQLEDHTNELKATRYHLEDMRVLAKVKT